MAGKGVKNWREMPSKMPFCQRARGIIVGKVVAARAGPVADRLSSCVDRPVAVGAVADEVKRGLEAAKVVAEAVLERL